MLGKYKLTNLVCKYVLFVLTDVKLFSSSHACFEIYCQFLYISLSLHIIMDHYHLQNCFAQLYGTLLKYMKMSITCFFPDLVGRDDHYHERPVVLS